jgi:hypothetical protein
MNWIHARYGAAVSNGDLIHTLALFVLEPLRYIDEYEWRKLERIEKVALFQYWKEIGNRMGMVGIPETLDDLIVWTRNYEQKHMFYSPNNTKCYEGAVNLYLRDLPPTIRPVAKSLADSLMEDYVRDALGVPVPPSWAPHVVDTFFSIRATIIQYFFLPRFRSAVLVTQAPEGRLQRKTFLFEPWYVKETSWTRVQRVLASLGLVAPEKIPGPEFGSEGYYPEELGPKEFKVSGREAVLMQAERLGEYAEKGGAVGTGCPFGFAR